MDFIKDLYESRMTRNDHNVRSLTYTDCCERTFLSLMILELLRQYPSMSSNVVKYAKNSLSTTSYSKFQTNKTDLHNFIYFIIGDETALIKLKDPEAASKLRKTVTLPTMAVGRYLNQIAAKTIPTNVSEFFIKIEKALRISNSDYKLIRRYITNYNNITSKERKEVVTKLLLASRAKLRNSDIIDDLQSLVSSNNLETNTVIDNEPTVSVPDISTAATDMQPYRLLVGADNVWRTKRFLDLAKNGKTIPAELVAGYLPIIKMIDDFNSKGIGAMQLLRQLHKRIL